MFAKLCPLTLICHLLSANPPPPFPGKTPQVLTEVDWVTSPPPWASQAPLSTFLMCRCLETGGLWGDGAREGELG